MNLAAVFAALIHLGVCAPMHFAGPDGTRLTVLVCPYAEHEEAPESAPPAPPPAGKRV